MVCATMSVWSAVAQKLQGAKFLMASDVGGDEKKNVMAKVCNVESVLLLSERRQRIKVNVDAGLEGSVEQFFRGLLQCAQNEREKEENESECGKGKKAKMKGVKVNEFVSRLPRAKLNAENLKRVLGDRM